MTGSLHPPPRWEPPRDAAGKSIRGGADPRGGQGPGAEEERSPGARSRGDGRSPTPADLALAILFGGLAMALVAGLDRGLDPAFDEALWLRWVRKAAEHPWRTGLGCALIALAWRLVRGHPAPALAGPREPPEGAADWESGPGRL